MNSTKKATQHTPEPWIVHEGSQLTICGSSPDGGHFWIAEMNEWNPEYHPEMPGNDRANASRIVACVNACKGISTEALEQGVIKDQREALEQARAALPAAWKAVDCDVPREVIELIDAALAKATK